MSAEQGKKSERESLAAHLPPPDAARTEKKNKTHIVEWALASIIAVDGAAAAGIPTPEEVVHDRTVCQNHTYLEHEALR